MKTLAFRILRSLIFAAGLIFSMPSGAQTFTTLHLFSSVNGLGDNTDGIAPESLVISGNRLYGVTYEGGTAGEGAVFALNIDGTGFTNFYNFTNGTDGGLPGSLILSSNVIYGTTQAGGSGGEGTLFSISNNGVNFTVLHSFTALAVNGTNTDGADPFGLLFAAGNTLYGTTSEGGTNGSGAIFSVNSDGSGFTNLYSFNSGSGLAPNAGGRTPSAGVILSGGILYGTATHGGLGGQGTVFSLSTDGADFSSLYNFTNGGTDGADPTRTLILSNNVLYGVTAGGSAHPGTIFKINADGTGFVPLYDQADGTGAANPNSPLVLSGNTLYGVAAAAVYPGAGHGSVFALNTNGSNFTTIYSFTNGTDGSNPGDSLLLSGNSLYGTAVGGYALGSSTSSNPNGDTGYGTVFRITFAPQLAIVSSPGNVVLSWPTNVDGFDYTGYSLLSATSVTATTWNAVSPGPVVINGQETVTNAVSGSQMFYRLSE